MKHTFLESNKKINNFLQGMSGRVKEIVSLSSFHDLVKTIRNTCGVLLALNMSGCVAGIEVSESPIHNYDSESVNIVLPQIAMLRCEYLEIMVETPLNTEGCLDVYTKPALIMDFFSKEHNDTLLQLEMPHREKRYFEKDGESIQRIIDVNILDHKNTGKKEYHSREFKYTPGAIEMPEKFTIYADYYTKDGNFMSDSVVIHTFDCEDITINMDCYEESNNVLHCQYNVGNYTPIDLGSLIISSTFDVEGAILDSVIVKNSTFDDYDVTSYSLESIESFNRNNDKIHYTEELFRIQEYGNIESLEVGKTATADIYYYISPTEKDVVGEKNSYAYFLDNEFHDHFRWNIEQYHSQVEDIETSEVCPYDFTDFPNCEILLVSVAGGVEYQGDHAGLKNINVTDGNYEIRYTCLDSQPSGKVIVRGGQVTHAPCPE